MARTRWRPAFLEALSNSCNVTVACRAAGISRQHAYRTRHRSAKFASDWDDAMQTGLDLLEAAMMRRAREGVEEPVYYKGQVVGTVRKASDVLAMFLMKRYRPEFRDSFGIEHSGEVGGPVPTFVLQPLKPDDNEEKGDEVQEG